MASFTVAAALPTLTGFVTAASARPRVRRPPSLTTARFSIFALPLSALFHEFEKYISFLSNKYRYSGPFFY
jgi:hypothetical protein